MRLLRTDTQDLQLESHSDDTNIPKYAILSHTWMKDEDEVTFSDLSGLESAKLKPGWKKLDYARKQARRDGLDFVWVDTCCIDKTSSAELAEAINSMFTWYRNAVMCYVYLSDALDQSVMVEGQISELIKACRWFTRGWTLQELLAPSKVVFYNSIWTSIGTIEKQTDIHDGLTRGSVLHYWSNSMSKSIAQLTGIQEDALLGFPLERYSLAQRMCWASSRTTTRTEDQAYSLLGIFDINMPVIYGEGQKAFQRLQQEVLRTHPDQTLFVWTHLESSSRAELDRRMLLAPSPAEFKDSGSVVPLSYKRARAFEPTTTGVRLTLPTSNNVSHPRGILHCCLADDRTKAIAIELGGITKDGDQEDFLIMSSRRIQFLDAYTALKETSEKTINILMHYRPPVTAENWYPKLILVRCQESIHTGSKIDLLGATPDDSWQDANSTFVLSAGVPFESRLTVTIDGISIAILLLTHTEETWGDMETNADLELSPVADVEKFWTVNSSPLPRHKTGVEKIRRLSSPKHVLDLTARMFEQLINEQWMIVVEVALSKAEKTSKGLRMSLSGRR